MCRHSGTNRKTEILKVQKQNSNSTRLFSKRSKESKIGKKTKRLKSPPNRKIYQLKLKNNLRKLMQSIAWSSSMELTLKVARTNITIHSTISGTKIVHKFSYKIPWLWKLQFPRISLWFWLRSYRSKFHRSKLISRTSILRRFWERKQNKVWVLMELPWKIITLSEWKK